MPFDKPTSDLLLLFSLHSILGMINPIKWRQRLHLDPMRCLKSGLAMPSRFFWMFMAILVFEQQRRPVDLFPYRIQGCPLRHLEDYNQTIICYLGICNKYFLSFLAGPLLSLKMIGNFDKILCLMSNIRRSHISKSFYRSSFP